MNYFGLQNLDENKFLSLGTRNVIFSNHWYLKTARYRQSKYDEKYERTYKDYLRNFLTNSS